jgi:hypothetical protein
LKASLVGFAWRSLVISALWLGLTEALDVVVSGERFQITLRETLVALVAGSMIVAARTIQNEIEIRKQNQ